MKTTRIGMIGIGLAIWVVAVAVARLVAAGLAALGATMVSVASYGLMVEEPPRGEVP